MKIALLIATILNMAIASGFYIINDDVARATFFLVNALLPFMVLIRSRS
jgi:hypothetical protein